MHHLVTIYYFLHFVPEITAQGPTFQVHLMRHMSTKIDNTWTKMVTWHSFISKYSPFSPINITTTQSWPKKTNSDNLELSDLTVHDDYFEPTVNILSNRINGCKFSHVFHGLRMKKIESKNHKKTSHPPVSIFLLSPSAFYGSLFFFSHCCLVSCQLPLL